MTETVEAVVYIVDDDEAVRNSLQKLLNSVNLTSKSFASANEFLEGYRPERPGCLLLDVRMPEMSGLELQNRLKGLLIELPVIILSGHADVPMVIHAMKAGAADFLEKPFNPQVLLDKIQTVLEQSAKAFAYQNERREIRQRLESLTQRERLVLDYVVDGAPNKKIAFELGISERTVEAHRGHVMEKLQAKAAVDLVKILAKAETDS